MTFRTILAGTAIAAIALAAGTAVPAGISFVPRAEAAVNFSFSLFYDELEPHGDWLRYRDAYVFIPADVDPDWRPYTYGHWVHTSRYGWTWVSDEPFGWATYHYGRWGYGEDIGWYWVPGTRWAPAWVSWRRSNDYIVWAPLPPSGDGVDISVSISVGDIPEFYWVAVPARQFLAPEIHVVFVKEEREVRHVIERTEFLGAPRVTNSIVINNVVDVDVIAEATGQKVKTVEVRETDDPRQAKASDAQVTVFQGEVAPDEKAKPKKLRKAEEVKRPKREDSKKGEAAGTETIPQPDTTKGSKAAQEPEEEQPAADSGVITETPKEKTARKPAAESGKESVEEQQPTKRKARKQAKEKPEAEEDTTGTTTVPEAPAAEEKGQGKAKKEKQKRGQDKKACDPDADPDCQPAQ